MKIPRLFLLFFLIYGCNPSNMNEKLTESLSGLFSPLEQDSLSGGAVFVEIRGKVLFEKSFGFADFETREKFTEKTVANLGSISKTFVAYGILKLQEEGKLSIDDPISKYFPDFADSGISNKITIRHFLTHTSGIPDSRKVDEESEFYLTAGDEENFAPLKQTTHLEFEPGTNWNYSNPAFNGLALIIEQVSGQKWQEYIRANILTPSGMTKSTITDGAHPESGVAHAYIFKDGQPMEYDFGEYPTFCASGNGGVWSSIVELRNYYNAIKGNTFVSEKTIAASLTRWIPENWGAEEAPHIGLSWFIYEPTPEQPYKIVEHTGSQGGFTAIMTMIPEKDLLILMLFNTPQKVSDLRKSVIEQLTKSGYL